MIDAMIVKVPDLNAEFHVGYSRFQPNEAGLQKQLDAAVTANPSWKGHALLVLNVTKPATWYVHGTGYEVSVCTFDQFEARYGKDGSRARDLLKPHDPAKECALVCVQRLTPKHGAAKDDVYAMAVSRFARV